MAFPLILVFVAAFIILFAWKRTLFLRFVAEFVMDIGLGILFTMIIYLIYPMTPTYVTLCVVIIAVLFFIFEVLNKRKQRYYKAT
jgi:hypothetical protein